MLTTKTHFISPLFIKVGVMKFGPPGSAHLSGGGGGGGGRGRYCKIFDLTCRPAIGVLH